MSDNLLTIIPTLPDYVPDDHSRGTVLNLFRGMVSAADEIKAEESDHLQFFDAGSNFEYVACPSCHGHLDTAWWGNAMDRAFQHQTPVLAVVLPCCGVATSLNNLTYSWPQGFARYSLAARNPQIRELSPSQIQQLERAIGCTIRLVWSHY